jgi:hypothetical protein
MTKKKAKKKAPLRPNPPLDWMDKLEAEEVKGTEPKVK